MKLSDYVIGQLADWGVRHIFVVTGSGAMHLNDSIGKEQRIQYICNHHEQASANGGGSLRANHGIARRSQCDHWTGQHQCSERR